MTPEQYLEIERSSEYRSEYYDGGMFAMSGGTLPHSLIGIRLTAALYARLQNRRCEIANSGLRVGVSPTGPFLYPDATVYCGDPRLADANRDTLLNPTVVFEILSKSSEAFDRGHKFALYRRIESLREYVLLSQTEPAIEVLVRGPEAKWILTEFVGMDSLCHLTSVDCDIALADIYSGVGLESL